MTYVIANWSVARLVPLYRAPYDVNPIIDLKSKVVKGALKNIITVPHKALLLDSFIFPNR